jgi:hypothetical protein
MKRGLVRGLLVAGVILGFGAGFAHVHHGHHGWRRHRQETMQRFARECVRAARETRSR